MPKQSFAFEADGEKCLEVSWSGIWKDTIISFNGKTIGVIPTQKALFSGQEFALSDGSVLKVQLINMYVTTELRILRNGQPLPGSSSDPQIRLKNSYQVIYLVAGLNIILGSISLLFNIELFQRIGINFGSIIFGLIFLLLGFFVQRKSTIALILTIGIFALDSIAGFFLSASRGINAGSGLIVRILILIGMFQGLGAIKSLKRKSA